MIVVVFRRCATTSHMVATAPPTSESTVPGAVYPLYLILIVAFTCGTLKDYAGDSSSQKMLQARDFCATVFEI